MVEALLVRNVWISLAACLVFYLVDDYLGMYETALYKTLGGETLVLEGRYERASSLLDDNKRPRLVSVRLAGILAALTAGVLALWWLFTYRYNRPEVFLFCLGGLLLVEAASLIQSIRAITVFRYIRDQGGVKGKIELPRKLVVSLAYVEMYAFTGLYLLAFIVSGSWFFLGGTLTSFVMAQQRRDYALLQRRTGAYRK